jgi:hypothetical protein
MGGGKVLSQSLLLVGNRGINQRVKDRWAAKILVGQVRRKMKEMLMVILVTVMLVMDMHMEHMQGIVTQVMVMDGMNIQIAAIVEISESSASRKKRRITKSSGLLEAK